MKVTAKAHTNIALIKYWGKRDETLFLPMNSSISITLDYFYTITSVQFSESFSKDTFIFNNEPANEKDTQKVTQFLAHIRNYTNKRCFAHIDSKSNVPMAAGLASSASGYAALAAASSKALGLTLHDKELSKLARQGSGSASRSIFGGFVEWQRGKHQDGEDSYAKPILGEQDWDLRILSVMVTSGEKEISSRAGMKRTVGTSPFYKGWLAAVEKDLKLTREAIKQRDFQKLGQVMEANALKMHATMLGASPPIMYWRSATVEVMEGVRQLRKKGVAVYFTIDAGPNVKVLCLPEDANLVIKEISTLPAVQHIYTCRPGPGVTYLKEP